MYKNMKLFQCYISIGLAMSGLAYLLYEANIISDEMRLGFLILAIGLEIVGVIKCRRSHIHKE